jgi:hypothetical protein
MPVKIIITKKVNIQKLIQEFAAAGFLQTSSRENEFITVEDTDDETTVKRIYKDHNSAEKLPTQESLEKEALDLKEKLDALLVKIDEQKNKGLLARIFNK